MKIIAKAPLFQDPIYDGAADPTIIWNKKEKAWWIFYTNRRAWGPNHKVSFMHGTDIGIASSSDGGANWVYRGTVKGLEFEPGRNTFWAPEVLEENGKYHMYVSYVRGIPLTWDFGRKIIHYTSDDLWNWKYENELKLSSDRVIDACVFRLPDKSWKMWYKDECHGSHTYAAVSNDLYNWKVKGAEITDCEHEGPNVFYFKGYYWMITDPWDGLGVYRSDDCEHWTRCSNILKEGGTRPDDGTSAAHADVLVVNERAYIFYFTHPEKNYNPNDHDFIAEYRRNRSSVQVAELVMKNGELYCDRNQTELEL